MWCSSFVLDMYPRGNPLLRRTLVTGLAGMNYIDGYLDKPVRKASGSRASGSLLTTSIRLFLEY